MKSFTFLCIEQYLRTQIIIILPWKLIANEDIQSNQIANMPSGLALLACRMKKNEKEEEEEVKENNSIKIGKITFQKQ